MCRFSLLYNSYREECCIWRCYIFLWHPARELVFSCAQLMVTHSRRRVDFLRLQFGSVVVVLLTLYALFHFCTSLDALRTQIVSLIKPSWCWFRSVFCLTQKWEGHLWQMKRAFQSFFESTHFFIIKHTGGVSVGGKYHNCTRSSPIWSLGKLHVLMKPNLQCSKPWTEEFFGLFVRFKCGLVFWKGGEKFGKSVERPHTLEGKQERMH